MPQISIVLNQMVPLLEPLAPHELKGFLRQLIFLRLKAMFLQQPGHLRLPGQFVVHHQSRGKVEQLALLISSMMPLMFLSTIRGLPIQMTKWQVSSRPYMDLFMK